MGDSSDWRANCLKAIEVVSEHPAAGLFLSPVEAGTDTDGDYYSIVKNPKDFGTIKKDLEDGKYKSADNVISDVELIWKNAALFNGDKSDVTTLAKLCYDMFLKKMRDYDLLPVNLWCIELFRLNSKLNEMMGSLPQRLKSYGPQQSTKEKKKEKLVATDKEMRNFCEAASMLTSDEDITEMTRIIHDNQPEFNVGSEEVKLDVSKFTTQTFNALMQYMMGALGKKGLSYPSL